MTGSTTQILLETTPETARLVAYLGHNRAPEGYWPTDDHDAFKAALADYALSHINLIDDRADPLPAGDDEHHRSLHAYLYNLSIADA